MFSRDGTRIAFKRLPLTTRDRIGRSGATSMVADADGGHPIVLDPDVHSPSPMTWSGDGRFLVYSRTVGKVDQVFIAAVDGSMRRQVTPGTQSIGARPCRRTAERSRSSGPARATRRSSGFTSSRSTARASGASRPVRSTDSIPPSGRPTRPRCCSPRISYPTQSIPTMAICWLSGWTASPSVSSSRRLETTYDPTWSPDGLFIAYLNKIGDRSRVMVAAADGSDPQWISDVGDWFNPQWSPDARHVLAVDGRTGGGQPIVAILDPLGKEPAASFALPDVSGFGRADLPSWQRQAR